MAHHLLGWLRSTTLQRGLSPPTCPHDPRPTWVPAATVYFREPTWTLATAFNSYALRFLRPFVWLAGSIFTMWTSAICTICSSNRSWSNIPRWQLERPTQSSSGCRTVYCSPFDNSSVNDSNGARCNHAFRSSGRTHRLLLNLNPRSTRESAATSAFPQNARTTSSPARSAAPVRRESAIHTPPDSPS